MCSVDVLPEKAEKMMHINTSGEGTIPLLSDKSELPLKALELQLGVGKVEKSCYLSQ